MITDIRRHAKVITVIDKADELVPAVIVGYVAVNKLSLARYPEDVPSTKECRCAFVTLKLFNPVQHGNRLAGPKQVCEHLI